MVCRYCCRAQVGWMSTYVLTSPSLMNVFIRDRYQLPFCWRIFVQTSRCKNLLKIGCEFRFLADPTLQRLSVSHYLSNSIWALLFKPPSFRDYVYPGTLSVLYLHHFTRPSGNDLPSWWYFRVCSSQEEQANVTLNLDKCEFSESSVSFLGQVIDHIGIWLKQG